MARGVNKVILIGNLGQDPEVRFTPSGSAVCNLNLATTDTWNDRQSGQRQERTEWHRVVMFNKLAEVAQQYVKKGSRLYIEGRLQTRKWQDQNGNDRYSTEIVANDMQMLDTRGEGGGGNFAGGRPQQAPQQGGQQPAAAPQQGGQFGGQQPAPQQGGQFGGQQPAPQQGGQFGGQQSAPQQGNNFGGQQPAQQNSSQNNNFGAPPAGSFDDFDDEIPF